MIERVFFNYTFDGIGEAALVLRVLAIYVFAAPDVPVPNHLETSVACHGMPCSCGNPGRSRSDHP
jgi:hypothetical protein